MSGITDRNRFMVDRAVGLPSVETVDGGLSITSWSMLDDIIEAARAQERAVTIERCAVAAEAQDRAGYEWLRDSVWAAILKRAGQNVRALAHRTSLPSNTIATSGPAEAVEACVADIKAGLCCPRVHGCEQNDDDQYCLVRQAFIRAGLLPDPDAATPTREA